MKKLILLAAFSFFILVAVKAQFETGQKILSGGISLSNNNIESTDPSTTPSQSFFNFGINGSFGKFVKPNHAVGFGIYYSNSTQTGTINYFNQNQNIISINYFSSYYKSFAKNLYGWLTWYASGNYTFASGANYIQKAQDFGIGASIVPDITYKISKRVLLNASLNNLLSLSYSHNETNYVSSTNPTLTQNSFGFSSSLSTTNIGNIGLGFSVLLNKK